MATRSMTGFGRGTGAAVERQFVAEVRSVNHKFLEVKMRLPFGLQGLEGRMQALCRNRLSRGRIDITVTVGEGSAAVLSPRVDAALAGAYVTAFRQLAATLGVSGQLSISDLIRLHETLLVTEPAVDLNLLAPGVEKALDAAITDLERMRVVEGGALSRDLDTRLTQVDGLTVALGAIAPQALAEMQQRLMKRVQELTQGVAVDPQRMAQECALLAERSDMAEEFTRLKSHIAQFRKLLSGGEPAGRKLDFLCQELNREANTLGSKCNHAGMAALVVDLKAEIERIREQVQNVE